MAKRLTPALEAAARNNEQAARAWRDHRKVCHGCNRAEADSRPLLACDGGYRLWQAVTRAGREEARLRAPEAGEAQLTLGAV